MFGETGSRRYKSDSDLETNYQSLHSKSQQFQVITQIKVVKNTNISRMNPKLGFLLLLALGVVMSSANGPDAPTNSIFDEVSEVGLDAEQEDDSEDEELTPDANNATITCSSYSPEFLEITPNTPEDILLVAGKDAEGNPLYICKIQENGENLFGVGYKLSSSPSGFGCNIIFSNNITGEATEGLYFLKQGPDGIRLKFKWHHNPRNISETRPFRRRLAWRRKNVNTDNTLTNSDADSRRPTRVVVDLGDGVKAGRCSRKYNASGRRHGRRFWRGRSNQAQESNSETEATNGDRFGHRRHCNSTVIPGFLNPGQTQLTFAGPGVSITETCDKYLLLTCKESRYHHTRRYFRRGHQYGGRRNFGRRHNTEDTQAGGDLA